MKGVLLALAAGFFITLQGVANTSISGAIGTWQAAALTQLTGFIGAVLLALLMKDLKPRRLLEIRPVYGLGGAFAALIIFGTVTAIQQVGVTLATSLTLLGQLGLTFLIEWKGWLGVPRTKMGPAQLAGMAMMVAGVVLLSL